MLCVAWFLNVISAVVHNIAHISHFLSEVLVEIDSPNSKHTQFYFELLPNYYKLIYVNFLRISRLKKCNSYKKMYVC